MPLSLLCLSKCEIFCLFRWAYFYILDIQLNIFLAVPLIFFNVITDIEWSAAADVGEMIALLEGNGRKGSGCNFRMSDGQFQMIFTDNPAITIVDNPIGLKNRRHIARSERSELFEYPHKLLVDLVELNVKVNFNLGGRISSLIIRVATVSNFSIKAFRFSGFIDKPAAYLCPPKCSSRSLHSSIAS